MVQSVLHLKTLLVTILKKYVRPLFSVRMSFARFLIPIMYNFFTHTCVSTLHIISYLILIIL